MKESLATIHFDLGKHPDIQFEVLNYQDIFGIEGMDHDPLAYHQIDFYIMLFVHENQGAHGVDFQTISFQPGSLLTIRKDQIHKFIPNQAQATALIFTEDFVLSEANEISVRTVHEFFNELLFSQHTKLSPALIEEANQLLQIVQREFKKERDESSPAIIRNLLQSLIYKIHRERKKHSTVALSHTYTRQFLAFQGLVEDHCFEEKSVKFYADQLAVTTKTLNNTTRNVLNISAKSFIDQLLTMRIKRQLLNSSDSIKQIAYDNGFDEPSNLFKFFKRNTDQTPEEFRKENS